MRKHFAAYPWVCLAALSLALTACANVTKNFGTVDFDLTVLRAGQPAPFQRLVIWLNETRMERVTDAHGKLVVTESYTWEGQTLAVVGPITHAPKPDVSVSLATDPGKQTDGKPALVKEPKDAWKLTMTLNAD